MCSGRRVLQKRLRLVMRVVLGVVGVMWIVARVVMWSGCAGRMQNRSRCRVAVVVRAACRRVRCIVGIGSMRELSLLARRFSALGERFPGGFSDDVASVACSPLP